MAKKEYQSIDQYHASFPPDVVKRMQQIRDVVHKVVPAVEEVISYQIPCFKYKGYLIYYSAYAKHISLSHPFSKELLEQFADTLKHYKVSKSAIQFPNEQPLPLDLITRIVNFRKQENDANSAK
ncbi:MAG TPA: DUF1801 domain-containing protein [Chryseolinea sp.]|nr:DUF1801 domain-containing protein [Chryseolinea sp.]